MTSMANKSEKYLRTHLSLHASHLGQMFLVRSREPVVDPEPPETERVPEKGDGQEERGDKHVPFDHRALGLWSLHF